MTGNYPNRTPLDDALEAEEREFINGGLSILEAEQDAHEATLEAESDPHLVLRHTEFFPLHPDMRTWSIAEVDAALGLRDQAAIEQRAQEAEYSSLGRRVL